MKIENNAKQRGERELGVEENEGSKRGVVERGNGKRVSRGRRESRETKVEDEGEEMRCKNENKGSGNIHVYNVWTFTAQKISIESHTILVKNIVSPLWLNFDKNT